MKTKYLFAALVLSSAACGGASPKSETPSAPETATDVSVDVAAPKPKEQPPASGQARDLSFPAVHHITLDNGLTIDVVTQKQLPIVSMELVVQSGGASDPEGLPGVASAVADMLKEGTKKKTGAQFAEAIEFLGARLSTGAGNETLRISMNALAEQFDAALALVAEATLTPSFDPKELEKLKKRTLDELKLKKEKPQWLARREFQRALYGEHPYAQYDTTEAAVKKLKRGDLTAFHGAHFAPNNAFMVVVGDVVPEQVAAKVGALFGAWKRKTVAEPSYAAPPERSAREIIVVDRPASVQSQIVIGNVGVKRNDARFIPLMVANQILGGSAASRLFMDLREKRSLTYGAYSRVDETVDVGAFRASAAVRTPVTGEAVKAFFEHLERIVKEPAPQPELEAAHRFLADSFPLQIETADRVADLLADLRVYGLPEGYWDTFRSRIREVSTEEALKAAQASIQPERALVVVVGRAAEVVPMLEPLGPVRVVDTEGKQIKPTGPETAPTQAAPGANKPGQKAPSAPNAAQPSAAQPSAGTPSADKPGQKPPASGGAAQPSPGAPSTQEKQTTPPTVPAPAAPAVPAAPSPQ